MAITSEVHFSPQQLQVSYLDQMAQKQSQIKQIPLSAIIHLRKETVKQKDMLPNALPKEGLPFLKPLRTTLKYGQYY